MIDLVQSWPLPVQILVGLGVALVLLFAYRWVSFWLAELRRTRAVHAVAVQMEFQPAGRHRDALLLALESLNPEEGSHKGVSPELKNLIRGHVGPTLVTVFDHEMEIDGAALPIRHTAVCLEDPSLDLPRFELHPRLPFGEAAAADAPTTGYLLRTGKTPDEDARRRFDAVMDALADHPGFSLVGGGAVLVCFRAGRRVKPRDWPELVQEAGDIHAVLRG